MGLKKNIRHLIYRVILGSPASVRNRAWFYRSWLGEKNALVEAVYVRLLALWFEFEYLTEQDPDKREALKALFMGGETGARWAGEYDSVSINPQVAQGTLSFREAQPVIFELEDYLAAHPEVKIVIQIGSSSGREIAWLAAKFPGVQFIGTDVYPEVVAYSTKTHDLENLKFETVQAKEINKILAGFKDTPVAVFSSLSLQYVQPEHLLEFFEELKTHGRISLFLVEPLYGKAEVLYGAETSTWRGNFSWNHPYRFLAKQYGFTTLQCLITYPHASVPSASLRKKMTGHCFYAGKLLETNK